MVKTLVSTIDIGATPERVWDVLSDLTAYREWNPFIEEAVGTAEAGNRLMLRMRPVGGRASTLRPTVVEAQRGELLRWRGRVAIPGLLEADHSFVLEATSDSRTRLVQREHFRGLLVPFLSGALDRGTLPAFALMNEALKRRAEQPVGTPHG